jgi:uncharacterized integral membrane protein
LRAGRADIETGMKRYSRAVSQQTNWEGMPKKEGRGFRFYVLAVAGVLLLILIAQNAQKVEIDLLFVNTEAPLIVALVIAGALGALIGWALPHVRRSRKAERGAHLVVDGDEKK